ncbi:MAG: N-6 DNA methylase [Candidatus Magasanikiibacteriota bacterium]
MLQSAQKKFISLLSKIDYTKRLFEVFNDFCILGTYSLALPFYKDLASKELEKVYARYTREQLIKFDEMFTVMVEGMEIHNGDFLGEIFGECEFRNDRQGQFFTPYNVSLMIAKMTFSGCKEQIERNGFITMNEPASGSGGMVIAFRQVMIDEQCNPSRDVFVVTQDISELAFMMCYIQCSLYGLAAEVVHGNTLSMEIWRVLKTPVYFITDWRLRLALKDLSEFTRSLGISGSKQEETMTRSETEDRLPGSTQLDLF